LTDTSTVATPFTVRIPRALVANGLHERLPRLVLWPPSRYDATFKLALAKAKITDYVRPFHDGRHTPITNDAASGNAPLAIMKRAGHATFSTTQVYIDLAGEMFREEAERLERRLLGSPAPALDSEPMGRKNG